MQVHAGDWVGYVGKTRRSGIGADAEDEGREHLRLPAADARTVSEKGGLKMDSRHNGERGVDPGAPPRSKDASVLRHTFKNSKKLEPFLLELNLRLMNFSAAISPT